MLAARPIVFISHAHEDYQRASEIKEDLDRFEVDVFVAHKDIMPAAEWREAIITKIQSCDLFVALLTQKYRDSRFCDQESGMAMAWGKPVLPVAVELMPYGFVERFQAFFWDPNAIRAVRHQLAVAILHRLQVGPEAYVKALEASDTWESSGWLAPLVLDREDLTADHINRIARSAIENHEIRDSFAAQPVIEELLRRDRKSITPDLWNELVATSVWSLK